MIRARVSLPAADRFKHFQNDSIGKLKVAASQAVDRETRNAQRQIRDDMRGAALGRLGNAIGAGSDHQKGTVRNLPNNRFRTSGWLYIKGKSERTHGAIEAYTEGADIRPVRGQWLWIATDAVARRSGKKRMTPALYKASGSKTGELKFIPGRHAGEALLVIENVTVPRVGAGRARRLPRRGGVGATRERKDFVVAFVGIKHTSRSARVNPRSIIQAAAARVPNAIADFLGSESSR